MCLFCFFNSHLALWEEIGSPSLTNNSIKHSLLFFKFMWKKGYKRANDEKLNRFGNMLFYFDAIYFLYFIGLMLFSMLQGHRIR